MNDAGNEKLAKADCKVAPFVWVKMGLFCVFVTLTQGIIMTELFYLPPIFGICGLNERFFYLSND
jgi:hypothetical protein